MLKHLFKKELRYYYPSWKSWFALIINELIILSVFWYTAKAFVPNLNYFQGKSDNYFTYIVIGLLSMRLPSFFITIFSRKIKDATIEGTLDTYLLLPFSQATPIIIEGLIASLFEIIKIVITLSLAITFFNFIPQVSSILSFISLQIIVLPIFIGLGFIATAIFLRLGRGEAALGKLVSLATILAGTYFPTSVFPSSFEHLINYLSPFNLLLNITRTSRWEFFDLLAILSEGILFSALGIYLLSASFKHYRRNGTSFFFRS